MPDNKAGDEKAKVLLPLGRILIRLRQHQDAVEVLGRFITRATAEKVCPWLWEIGLLKNTKESTLFF